MAVGWLSLTEARARWRDAPADDSALGDLLNAAQSQVVAFAPTVVGVGPVGAPAVVPPAVVALDVPAAYRQAQWMQARNVANAGRVSAGSGSDLDGSGYGVAAYPLDWTVKQLLRPQQAIGAVV